MPTEVKQRKKSPVQSEQKKSSEEERSRENGKTETGNFNNSSFFDFKSLMCFVSLVACGALSWMVVQQNEKFLQIEEKFEHLHRKTSSMLAMEEEVLQVSKKLDASELDLQRALSAVSLTSRLEQDVAALSSVIVDLQNEETSASVELQQVNARFLNVTVTWQERLATTTSELTHLKAQSRQAHANATEGVNEAERRARVLEEKLQELEDSTKRNGRALERAEEDDAKKARDHLDWNTKQIQKLKDQISYLAHREVELQSQLQGHIPRAAECEEHLPKVEEAVRSILRLGADLSAAEKRLEEVTLQVFGTEDSMLKALNEILEIRREVDTLQAQSSIVKMKNELSVVKEAVHELTMVLRESRGDLEGLDQGEDEENWDGVDQTLENMFDSDV